jgi:hypothetical protein
MAAAGNRWKLLKKLFNQQEIAMPTIHTPGDGHVTPVTLGDGTKWDPYPNDNRRRTLDRALFILRHNVRNMRPCDNCFKSLPGGKTFTEVFGDPSIFISFDPSGPNRGVSIVSGNDITISVSEFRIGRWSVAATLVHELAHINGAPNNTGDAENMLNCCGFRAHFTGVIGEFRPTPLNAEYA